MTRYRDRRLDRIAGAKRERRPAPFVLRIAPDETPASARERFDAQWPDHGRALLVVPAKPRTAAELANYEQRLHEQQSNLVATARRDRMTLADANANKPRVPPRVWPSSPTIRPNGPRRYWKPNNGTQS